MNDAGRGQTLAPLPTVRATGTLLAAPRGSGRLPSPLVPGPSVVPRRSGRQSSALEPLCGGLGPQLPRGRWPPGPVSSRRPRQSLDAQPEQLALRPKEFFRAHGIEVLTEAQVRTTLPTGRGLEGLQAGFEEIQGLEEEGRAGPTDGATQESFDDWLQLQGKRTRCRQL